MEKNYKKLSTIRRLMPLLTLLLMNFVSLAQVHVEGVVSDKKGPLPGVSVKVEEPPSEK
ncbi:hypothetical protein [Mucilaginibacter sp. MD40]|uniref:hypothetical protein n=1 Tax=Mucilaginibacter sp. MD40 TaxID=2029590 RepID=UPI0018E90D47|nr:hypothetical protein [Mucilaginibacter sp. MD40]